MKLSSPPLYFPKSVFAFTAALCLAGPLAPAQAAKPSPAHSQAAASHAEALPIALVGISYGRYDVTSLTRNIFNHEEWVYHGRGGFLPAEEFKDYQLVIISFAQDRPYTAEEHAKIAQYVRNGGRILLFNEAPKSMADAESRDACPEWLGMEVRSIQPLTPGSAAITEDPVLAGVIGDKIPSWVAGKYGATNFRTGAEALIGSPDGAIVARHKFGKGVVYYLAHQPFRLRTPKSPYKDSESYFRLIRNIIVEANSVTLSQMHDSDAELWTRQGKRFLLWNREWREGTESGPVFVPPLPEQKEVIDSLKVNLACDESEALQVNLTDLGTGGVVTWKTNLGGFPQSALEVFVQDQPDPIPWPKNPAIARESPFWLMPPKAVEPKGEEAVRIKAGQTRIFWLKFNSHKLAPGTAEGSIEFFVDGKSAGKLRLPMEIHPVRVPKRKAITLQALGHVYGDVNRPEPAMRFHRNLEELGFEWSLVNTMRPDTFRMPDGGALDPAFIARHLGEIDSPVPPAIDFSSMDGFIDAALEHNLTYFRVPGNLTASIDGLCKRAKLDPAATTAVRHWYLRELARYLKDKGIRNFYASSGDELSASELRETFLPWSSDLAQAGWTTTSSFSTGTMSDPALVQELAPSVGAWILNRGHIPEFMKWRNEGIIKLAPHALVGTYGAGEGRGTEIRKNASDSRMIGWEAWALGLDFCAPNPYFKGWLYYTTYSQDRGVAGERFVAYLDKENLDAPLVNSPFIEGMRESAEEANLAWILSWYLKKLGSRVPEAIREEARSIVGDGPKAIIQWKGKTIGRGETKMLHSTREEYLKAKDTVLALLDKVHGIAREAGIKPSLYWHDLALMTDGAWETEVVALSGDAAPVHEALRRLGGSDLPAAKSAEEAAKKVAIYIGDENAAGLPASLKAKAGAHPPHYSWIRDWTDAQGRTVIWIGGSGVEETSKAAKRFAWFLRPEGSWFVER